ncbi:MAG TPA: hypothetical protein VII70_00845 [Steroidobacteraceae bacterium]
MIIRTKPPRKLALHEPIRHDNHGRPQSRRDFLARGFLTGAAYITAPTFFSLFANPRVAQAALASDIDALRQQCGIATSGAGKIPFIAFDLAGGANLNGSEALIGGQGGQLDFLSAAGYANLGLPGDMVPNSPNPGSATNNFVDTSLGLAWHSDGGMLRGILSRTAAGTRAGTNGAVIAALSENDTMNNPHNPMYGIWKAGAGGQLLTLIGSEPTVSGGNSVAPADMIDLTVTPTVVDQASDVTGLVNTGQLGTLFSNPGDAVSVLESIARISGGTDPNAFGGKLGQVNMLTRDTAIKTALRCGYVKSADLVNTFGNPAALNPDLDTNIVGGSGIFSSAEYAANSDYQKTAAIMKMVINGFAGAGTIEMGGFDYHGQGRATGEDRNFQAGVCIGACLEYAARVGLPLMIYVFSDGSLNANGMVDNSVDGRGKLMWASDNQTTAASIMLVYNPKGRPALLHGATSQQIGFYDADGSVNTTSSPAANSVEQLVQTVILNYMALHGEQGQFGTLFPTQGLGSGASLDAITAFAPIVNGKIGA